MHVFHLSRIEHRQSETGWLSSVWFEKRFYETFCFYALWISSETTECFKKTMQLSMHR